MTTNMSPEERHRIQEVEALRLEVQKREGFRVFRKMLLIAGGITLFLLLCSLFGGLAILNSMLSSVPGA